MSNKHFLRKWEILLKEFESNNTAIVKEDENVK